MKYEYVKVIQQHFGQGWEDVSEYAANSQFIATERNNKPGPNGRTESLWKADLREYRATGYPTRSINRRVKIVQPLQGVFHL